MGSTHLMLKFVLTIGCTIILTFSLLGNIILYNQLFMPGPITFRREQISKLQNQIIDLQKQSRNLQNEINQLNTQITPLEKQIDDLNHEIINLQKENNLLLTKKINLEGQLNQLVLAKEGKTATLVTRLGARDLRYNYSGQDIRLYISGEVWNVGQIEAKNSRLHVTLYQGENVAKDTYISLGNLDPGSYVDVAQNIYYSGNALTEWKIISEFE
jgi:predicted RNase H-like nuclease (RuvC/YqgF family)